MYTHEPMAITVARPRMLSTRPGITASATAVGEDGLAANSTAIAENRTADATSTTHSTIVTGCNFDRRRMRLAIDRRKKMASGIETHHKAITPSEDISKTPSISVNVVFMLPN
jgi:hypothetical protein